MEESMHPFKHCKIGEIVSNNSFYMLRRYNDVFWKMSISDENFVAERSFYKDFCVIERKMNQDEINEFHKLLQIDKNKKEYWQEKLNSINTFLPDAQVVDFKKNEAILVPQRKYAISNAFSEYPVLAVVVSPCFILVLYDNFKKIAVLAHIDSFTVMGPFQTIFDVISEENTVAHLVGGNPDSFNLCIEILEFLEDHGIKIANCDVMRNSYSEAVTISATGDVIPTFSHGAASFAIDARTGVIYSPVKKEHLDKVPDMSLDYYTLQLSLSPLKLCYDGLQPKNIKKITTSPIKNILSQANPSKNINNLKQIISEAEKLAANSIAEQLANIFHCYAHPSFLSMHWRRHHAKFADRLMGELRSNPNWDFNTCKKHIDKEIEEISEPVDPEGTLAGLQQIIANLDPTQSGEEETYGFELIPPPVPDSKF